MHHMHIRTHRGRNDGANAAPCYPLGSLNHSSYFKTVSGIYLAQKLSFGTLLFKYGIIGASKVTVFIIVRVHLHMNNSKCPFAQPCR